MPLARTGDGGNFTCYLNRHLLPARNGLSLTSAHCRHYIELTLWRPIHGLGLEHFPVYAGKV